MLSEVRSSAQPITSTAWPQIELGANDRILILAPHPDDESLACGGVIQRALSRGLPARVVFLTLGDNNEWSFMVYRKRPEVLPWQARAMGEMRHDEALAAAQTLGLPPDALTFLGYPDFGTLHIWCSHWGDAPPFRSMLTRVTSVPYRSAYRRGAPYKGEEIVRDLTTVLREFGPTQIFVSHAADHNPDHAALYLFSRLALWDLREELDPQVHPFLVHYPRWPRPRGLAPDAVLAPPEQLAGRCAWHVLTLHPGEVRRKELALQAHRTQYGYCRTYLDSFVRAHELFGDLAPIPVSRAGPAASLPRSDLAAPATEPAEELEEEERVRFVGVESHTVRLAGDGLEFSIGLSRPMPPGVTVSFYCFGYRSDRPFAGMPKLHVEVGEMGERVADQGRALPRGAVEVRRTLREILVRVPRATLGWPQSAFLGAVTRLGDIPLSSQPWCILELAAPDDVKGAGAEGPTSEASGELR